jgi:hypothetical protein
MSTKRILLVTCAALLLVSSASAQHEWVGEVFFGWGDDNLLVGSMVEFNSGFYAGTYRVDGANIYVRAETPPWVPSAVDGFGNPNNSAAWAMADFQHFLGTWQNNLYVGVQNFLEGGQVWAYDGSQPWWQANSNGFGDPNNRAVTALATFADALWAGTSNSTTGAEIHSFTGVTWSEQMTGGFGNPHNGSIKALVEHNGKLYAATSNSTVNGSDEIWSTSDGTQWESQLPPGFFADKVLYSMVSAGGALYVGLRAASGAQVYRIHPTPMVQVNTTGFGTSLNIEIRSMVEYKDELYVGTTNNVSGGQVWRLRGTHWSQVNVSGFGDSNNTSITSLGVFNRRSRPDGDLFAGTQNGFDGCQVWRYPVVFADGFETGDTIGWSATVQ